jgi:hypothetical protein
LVSDLFVGAVFGVVWGGLCFDDFFGAFFVRRRAVFLFMDDDKGISSFDLF